MLTELLKPASLSVLIPILGSALLGLLGWLFKSKQDRANTVFAAGVSVAYNIVNDVSKFTPNTVDDKAALALGYLNSWMSAHGQKLGPADEEKAKLVWQAMHGEGK